MKARRMRRLGLAERKAIRAAAPALDRRVRVPLIARAFGLSDQRAARLIGGRR